MSAHSLGNIVDRNVIDEVCGGEPNSLGDKLRRGTLDMVAWTCARCRRRLAQQTDETGLNLHLRGSPQAGVIG
nr:hypothetical protein [Phytoactinopolyspora limicola]